MLFGILKPLLICALVFFLLKFFKKSKGPSWGNQKKGNCGEGGCSSQNENKGCCAQNQGNPIETLKERFARGDITLEEYEQALDKLTK